MLPPERFLRILISNDALQLFITQTSWNLFSSNRWCLCITWGVMSVILQNCVVHTVSPCTGYPRFGNNTLYPFIRAHSEVNVWDRTVPVWCERVKKEMFNSPTWKLLFFQIWNVCKLFYHPTSKQGSKYYLVYRNNILFVPISVALQWFVGLVNNWEVCTLQRQKAWHTATCMTFTSTSALNIVQWGTTHFSSFEKFCSPWELEMKLIPVVLVCQVESPTTQHKETMESLFHSRKKPKNL